MQFTQAVYIISESEGVLQLCASLTGRTEREISVSLIDVLLTASQEDFNLNLHTLSFFNTSEDCVLINIIQDGLFENIESFQVILQLIDSSVQFGDNQNASITIINSDGKK